MLVFEVGSGESKFFSFVPERTLNGISGGVSRMMAEKREVRSSFDRLRLPDDNPEAWKVLLYAQVARSLPAMFSTDKEHDDDAEHHLSLLAHCWLLGEKYEVYQFQDLVMAEMLESTACRLTHPNSIAIGANAPRNSELFTLKACEADRRLKMLHSRDFTVSQDLGRSDLPPDFVEEVNRWNAMPGWDSAYERFMSRRRRMLFMVDKGPDKRWLNVPWPFSECHEDLDDGERGRARIW